MPPKFIDRKKRENWDREADRELKRRDKAAEKETVKETKKRERAEFLNGAKKYNPLHEKRRILRYSHENTGVNKTHILRSILI